MHQRVAPIHLRLILCCAAKRWATLLTMAFAIAFAGEAAEAQIADQYEIVRIGLRGPGYEGQFGQNSSQAQLINEAGQVVGFSGLWNGSVGNGRAAWRDDGTGAVRLGLYGAEYTSSDGRQHSEGDIINEAGHVAGWSYFYEGTDIHGSAVWRDDGSGAVRLGLYGSEFATSTGYITNEVTAMNASGLVLGRTRIPVNDLFYGSAAWLDNGSGPMRLGYYDSAYFIDDEDGAAFSYGLDLNESGVAVGVSSADFSGQYAWRDDGTGPVRLGYRGAGYINTSSGKEFSTVYDINNAGQAAGLSVRYSSGRIGQYAWRDDGTGPIRLGLVGEGYMDVDSGQESSIALMINEAGLAAGHSDLHPGGSYARGHAAWIDDGSGAIRIGLRGTGYQNTGDQFEESQPVFLNEAGQVVGTSLRFNGTTRHGEDWWFDDGSGPVRLGLTGAAFSNPDDAGYTNDEVLFFNDAGFVAGHTERFDTAPYNGQSGWLYDSNTDTLHDLTFSIYEPLGFAATTITDLLDDGTVIGHYADFEESIGDNIIFAWNQDTGLVNLGEIATSFENTQWDTFGSVTANEDGLITGTATHEIQNVSTGQSAYLLRPIELVAGDLNGDGVLTNADISAFVQALTDPDGYATDYADLDPDVLGDFDEDGFLTNADIAGFVEALTGGSSQSFATAVPEPSSLALLTLGSCLVVRRRRADAA